MAERPKLGSIDATGAARNRGVSPQERDPVPSRSNGRPLEPAARGYFEPRFGHDFSRVRVHYDPHAEALAHALNARAYTVGRDIVFGKDQYAPGTSAGRRLLGHELTHVVQADLAGSSARPPDMAA